MFQPRALPYAIVNHGPLLFALPIPEKDLNTPADGAKWNYALDVNPSDASKIKVARKAREGRNPATGETIKIPDKTVVKFRVAKA